ncbi:unnamed protein product [Adineta steineri]|uniref:F-box domain-containing protein n=1 Tax=Adineta steineri TaxID=433720 RepID=A0A820AGK7_9BILA|nr:unnamed protein product [Adineta steineri]
MKLDELPHELIVKISSYLTLFDIGYSLIGVCNRLDQLFAENKDDRRTLALHNGHCSYSLYRTFIDDHEGFRSRRLNIFIRSLILDGFCNLLCAHDILSRWADSMPPFLPSVRKLTLSNMHFFYKNTSKSLAFVLTCGVGTNIIGQLDIFTLICDNADSWYVTVLHELIFLQASCHTMIFHVTDELLLILKESVTPCLEHLTVTFEDDNSTVRNLEDFYQDKNILTKSHLVTVNVMHLHTLTLRGSDQSDFSMNNVLLIIRYLKMPNLKSLTLIHVQTSLLNQLIEFRQAVDSSSLWISLKHFRFSLCLPIILRYEYETTEFGDVVFNTSNWLARGWGVRHIVEEHLSSTILVVYTYPCDLQNERILVNHRFVARTIDHNRQANVDHMVWLCRNSHTDSINLHSSDTVEHSLKILSRAYHLKWNWYTSPTGFSPSNFMQHKFYFPLHLRSLHLQVIGVDDTQTVIYVNLLQYLMTNAVLLQCLSVPWNVVRELGRCCSSTPSYRLTNLFLYFERSRPIPGQVQASYEPVDGSMLSQLFPRLRHLSLNGSSDGGGVCWGI